MTDGSPEFGPEFWSTVERRSEAVRGLVRDELDRAEHLVFSEAEERLPVGPDGKVVPMFTDPFWTEVELRAERVNELARESLAAAEAKLLGDDPATETVTVARRAGRTSALGLVSRTFNLQRADIFGFATALLAVVLLVPQLIAPVYSSAGVEPPRLLRFVIIGDGDETKQPERSSEEDSPTRSSVAEQSSDEAPAPAASPSSAAASSLAAESGSSGEAGIAGSEAGTPGTSEAGAPGVTAEPAPSTAPPPAASPAPPAPPKPPLAPAEVVAEAVDATSIRIAWVDASNDETGFQVERQTPEASPVNIEHAVKDSTSLVWTNLNPSTSYCFRVRSVGDKVRSRWSPAGTPGYVCATTPAAPAASPAPPPVVPEATAPPAPPPA